MPDFEYMYLRWDCILTTSSFELRKHQRRKIWISEGAAWHWIEHTLALQIGSMEASSGGEHERLPSMVVLYGQSHRVWYMHDCMESHISSICKKISGCVNDACFALIQIHLQRTEHRHTCPLYALYTMIPSCILPSLERAPTDPSSTSSLSSSQSIGRHTSPRCDAPSGPLTKLMPVCSSPRAISL
jgi:hypothetical protein